MKYQKISLGVLAVAIAAAFYFAPAFAVDPADTNVTPRTKAAPNEAAIPTCLDKLKLTQQQQGQIKEIVHEYDADLTAAWKEFGNRYTESIRTEVLLLSAIEDNLTEAQRQQVRAQRRKTAQHQKASASTKGKPNEATSQPASAVDEGMAIVGVSLTAEQENAADALQEKYRSHLRSLNRDIHGLHIRMVSLEADKFVEIENVLTKDQLQQLREIRKTPPAEHTAAAKKTSPLKSR